MASIQTVPVIGSWVATLDGMVNAEIQPQVGGYVIRQDYKEGTGVGKGQVLFEIDPRPWQATEDQASGSLAQEKAQYKLATINVVRNTPLVQAQVYAQGSVDTELGTQAADKASVESAEATLESAKLNVGFTKVRSLIDGVAGQAAIQVGNLVSTSSQLVEVSQVNPIKVYFFISEQEYMSLSARAHVMGKTDLLSSGDTLPVKLTLADNKPYEKTGRVISVDRAVTTQTGSIRIAASFANPGNLLRPSQFGTVSAQTDVLKDAIVIPQRAVNELQGLYQVVVVGADDIAHLRTVTLGPSIGTNAVIPTGIQGGTKLLQRASTRSRKAWRLRRILQVHPHSPQRSHRLRSPRGTKHVQVLHRTTHRCNRDRDPDGSRLRGFDLEPADSSIPEYCSARNPRSSHVSGADAKTLEQSVVTPIEQQLNDVDNMNYMYSTSASNGAAQPTVDFDVKTNPDDDQILTQLRVSQAQSQLPTEVQLGGITVQKSLSSPLMLLSVSSPKSTYDSTFLANYAYINVGDQLARVKGVSRVQVFGAGQYALRIWLKPEQMAKLGVTVTQITNALSVQNNVNPAGQINGEPVPGNQDSPTTC